MISLAFDTATDRCTVAATDGTIIVQRHLDGSRRHAAGLIGLIDESLAELGARIIDVERLLTGDGPGSFTGLRVATAAAKALCWRRQVRWSVAPSLLIRAAAHAPADGGVVLAMTDALRGEVYAGCWRMMPRCIERVGPAPRAMRPDQLEQFGRVDVVVAAVPGSLFAAVAEVTDRTAITGDAALPDARTLLRLVDIPGGTLAITSPAEWEPDYGRPAEAQAAWEREHGRSLPSSSGIPG